MTRTLTWGTSHFVSKAAAIAYYLPYEGNHAVVAAVNRKLAAGEIHIGPPTLKPGDRLTIVDAGTRYAIEAPDATPND